MGSKPSSPTVNDLIADVLADPEWRENVERRFWAKVEKSPSGCWPWMGAVARQGYGNFKVSSYNGVRASRLAYALHHGHSPGELWVLHKCDNPSCVNPDHLFLGTVQDNNYDKLTKGRARTGNQSGEANPSAKLTRHDVILIKQQIADGVNNTVLGRQFGVTHSAISAIRRGKVWSHTNLAPGRLDGG